ncbi:hypothetical protein BDW74DRAFT_177953 [Aspergillus multicolor]|uniref:uncharacterized protein n=1 Tax=Aspergillus multicolor TaxID=41759 RepID=UPI003CCCA979
MDHLLLPRKPRLPSLISLHVPILGDEPYDGGDFATYPDRQGWAKRAVRQWQADFEHPSKKFKAFLQRWLYFGLLHALLGSANMSNFMIEDPNNPGAKLLSTRKLYSHLCGRKDALMFSKELWGAGGPNFVCVKVLGSFNGSWKRKSTDPKEYDLNKIETFLQFVYYEEPTDPQDPVVTLSMAHLPDLDLHLLHNWTSNRLFPLFPCVSSTVATEL